MNTETSEGHQQRGRDRSGSRAKSDWSAAIAGAWSLSSPGLLGIASVERRLGVRAIVRVGISRSVLEPSRGVQMNPHADEKSRARELTEKPLMTQT